MSGSEMNQDPKANTKMDQPQDQIHQVTLTAPMGDQNLMVSVTHGQNIIADFDFGAVALEKAGAHIILRFPEGGSITLENINILIDSGQSPTIALQDGSVISAAQILASILSLENEVEPAAGESSQPSGGVSTYEDNPGTILDGVGKLDGLGFAQSQGIESLDAGGLNLASSDRSQPGSAQNGDGLPSIVVNDVNLTNDSTPIITGTAESGSTVIVEVGGVTMATTADGNGNWSVTVPDATPLSDGAYTITATATNAQGNFASATGGLEIDTAISADITLDDNITTEEIINAIQTNGDVSVTGTVGGDVTDGDTVTVTINGNTYTGQVSGGTFGVDVPGSDFAEDSDQSIDVSVTTTDTAGNMATAIDIGTYGDGAEITPPGTSDGPTASITLDQDITVDDVINAAESNVDVAITGKVGGDVTDGDTVTVMVNGNTYTGQVSDGSFSVEVPGSDLLADEGQTVTASVTITDVDGKVATATDTESYDVDTAISASIKLDADITSDDVVNAVESKGEVAITGTVGGDVADGDTVTVTVNGKEFTGQVSEGGFSIEVPGSDLVADGGQTVSVSVTTTDAAGNSITATDAESYSIDTQISASIKLDADITSDDVINAVESKGEVAITGTVGGDVADGDTVTVTVNGKEFTGRVSEGGFSIEVPGSDLVADGGGTIGGHILIASVTTTDAAGNSITATDTESYDVDTQISASIKLDEDITADDVINAVESKGDVAITGLVGEDVADGDTVIVTVNGNDYTGLVSGGTFSIEVPGRELAADSSQIIIASVTTTDEAGNSVTATDTESYDVDIAISASIKLDADITPDDVINAVESKGVVTITGTVGGDVSDGDTVTVTVNGNDYTGEVSEGGFSVEVPGSDLAADSGDTVGGHILIASVTTTDAAGNSATATDTESYDVVLGFDTAPDIENTRPTEPVEIDVLANDTGDGLQLVSVSVDGGDSVGTASVVDGKVVFTPSAELVDLPDAPESVGLTYTVKDAYGNEETGQAQVQMGIFYDEAEYAFDSFITDSEGEMLATAVDVTDGSEVTGLSATLYPESSTTFDIEITVDKSIVEPDIDTYFLQDLTGSFRDDLRNMTTDADHNGLTTLEEMVDVFEGKSGHSSYGTGTFVDTADGDGGNAHRQFKHGMDVSDGGDGAANAAVLQGEYDTYSARGGVDYPESQFYAIKEIAEAIIKVNGGNEELGIVGSTDPAETLGFTAGSNPVVVLSTDAVSHGYLADDEVRFGSDPNLSGINEMYAYVEASGMQLVVLAADHYSGNAGAVTFWNDVLAGKVGDVDSGWNFGGWDDGKEIHNTFDTFETGHDITGYVAELNTDSSNIVSALEQAVDNIEFTSPLSLITDSGANETDDFSYTDMTPGDFVENADGTYTQTWTVALKAPVGGEDDPDIAFTVTDRDGNPIGETIHMTATVADGGLITGTELYDTLVGSDTLSDTMYGEAGDDRMDGRDGDDTLDGGAGNDILVGGDGADLIIGGQGDDTMTGAGGSDTFAISANGGEGVDTIKDFDVTTDVIRLTDVLDAEGDHDIDINDLLKDGGQSVSANIAGADGVDVELTISNGSETTVVTLAGINANHNFDGDTTLSDLINHGLQIDPM